MKIYFLSSQPCALSFNSLYFGVTDKFERFAEISLKDKLFVEFLPQNAQPIRFFLTEDIRFSPPTGCEVYLSTNSITIYARDFLPMDSTIKIIAQERFLDNLITVFQQGVIHVSIESAKGFFISTLPPSFENCNISFHNDLFFISTQNQLAIYTKSGKCVFLEEFIDYSIEENTLNATLPLSDSLKRQAKSSYALTEEGCFQTSFLVQQNSSEKTREEISKELLPYVFFESVLLRANYQDFLSEELLPNADKIRSYLGDFEHVILTEDTKTCGLVKKKADRLFEIAYFTAEIENGKIADIHAAAFSSPKTPNTQNTPTPENNTQKNA